MKRIFETWRRKTKGWLDKAQVTIRGLATEIANELPGFRTLLRMDRAVFEAEMIGLPTPTIEDRKKLLNY